MSLQFVAQYIPSPSQGVWHLGPLPIRAYAICIILGVFAAVWLGERRWIARGGTAGQVGDVALWGVPSGLIGARVYHVITDHDLYFGAGNNPWDAFAVWHGGLGIWGAIAGGVIGGMFACRKRGILFRPMLDALAPALLLAQAIGRFGNYFNQELYGGPTREPWGLEIDAAHLPPGFDPSKHFSSEPYTFHPTFLYEAIWNLGALGLIVWADRRFRLGYGRCFALYVMAYCAGRSWIENLRIDNVEYKDVLGLRLNVWTSIILFALALTYFVVVGRHHRSPDSREATVFVEGHAALAAADEPAPGDAGQVDLDAAPADPGPGSSPENDETPG